MVADSQLENCLQGRSGACLLKGVAAVGMRLIKQGSFSDMKKISQEPIHIADPERRMKLDLIVEATSRNGTAFLFYTPKCECQLTKISEVKGYRSWMK